MKRRQFIRWIASISSFLVSKSLSANTGKGLYFGLCADVHKDLVPDADIRLEEFVLEAKINEVDFILQLGDFCVPHTRNDKFLNIFNSFFKPAYHVLGNHDMDGGYNKQDTMRYWSMPSRYYSFDQKGYHMIVLDGTVGDRFPWIIDKPQIDWLEEDLQHTNSPCLIFIHQPLEEDIIGNATEIRSILEQHNHKIIACFQGHRHMDYYKTINGIPYIEINSMSYYWLGSKGYKEQQDPGLKQKYPAIEYYTRYWDSLYCFVKIDKFKNIYIEGVESSFQDGAPQERGLRAPLDYGVRAQISSIQI